ncbi:hypothetical protein ACJX0J_022003, partial [Zea mays]
FLSPGDRILEDVITKKKDKRIREAAKFSMWFITLSKQFMYMGSNFPYDEFVPIRVLLFFNCMFLPFNQWYIYFVPVRVLLFLNCMWYIDFGHILKC